MLLSESVSAATLPDRQRRFRELHETGCFVIPNPWDAGSAKLLAQLGFQALATTSSGFAWTLGRADNTVTLDQALAHLRAVCEAVDVPVNADFEGGFAIEPDDVGSNVLAAALTGVAAARRATDSSGSGVLLTGRSEGFICGRSDFKETIRRLTAFAAAGAECLDAPGIRAMANIKAVDAAVAPKPVNVLVSSDCTTVAESGTFTRMARAVPGSRLDGAFVTQKGK